MKFALLGFIENNFGGAANIANRGFIRMPLVGMFGEGVYICSPKF